MILINNKSFQKMRFSDVETFLKDYSKNESFFVEFKNDEISNSDLIKEICAFSNTFGGYLILGVENNKTITGCIDWTEERINNIVRNLMSPIPLFDVKKLKKDNIKIYVIKVEEGVMPPYVTNKGIIYERVSSSSFPIKDSASINRILDKRKDMIKRIENKLYIDPISKTPDNLCGYLDYGVSTSFKDIDTVANKISNADYQEVANIIKKTGNCFSISKVGYSICITIGKPRITTGQDVLIPAGLSHYMEILLDGSFKLRIVLLSEPKSNVVSINSIIIIEKLFMNIYSTILKKDISENFIEARCYQKLNVLKVFEPKIMVAEDDEYFNKFEEYSQNHKNKYGSNIIVNSNRIPINGFYVIDKAVFNERKIKYNDDNLLENMFRSSYYMLGHFDKFEFDEKTDD